MDRNYKEILRDQLEKLTKRKSQAAIARAIGTTQTRISRLLSGEKAARFQTKDLFALSRITGLSIETLATGGGLLEEIERVKNLVMTDPERFVNSLNKKEKEVLLRILFESFDD